MSDNFEPGLRAAVAAMPAGLKKRRMEHLLSLPADNRRRKHAFWAMETNARETIGVDDSVDVDWTTAQAPGGTPIDWGSIIQQILTVLLPFLLHLLGG